MMNSGAAITSSDSRMVKPLVCSRPTFRSMMAAEFRFPFATRQSPTPIFWALWTRGLTGS
jgi:hypothetical protein